VRRVSGSPGARPADLRVALKIVYWAAVIAISVALVIGLILFFESRDQSSVESGAALLSSL
jgi:cytochrome b subunit of formate dehydrogenase